MLHALGTKMIFCSSNELEYNGFKDYFRKATYFDNFDAQTANDRKVELEVSSQRPCKVTYSPVLLTHTSCVTSKWLNVGFDPTFWGCRG